MSEDIKTIGIGIDTSGIDTGSASLDRLAAQGPKVDSALKSVETAAAKAGKSIASLAQTGPTGGLDKVSQSSAAAAASVKKLGDSATQTFNTVGISAGQAAQAMRQLPAQLQDFFIQLHGGQSFVTAFAQQGSQVAASFGGVGNALKSVGSLISPVVVGFGSLAAAAGALALAYNQGANETQAFTRSIVLSGNAAGVTTAQLTELARAQSLLVGTQGQAAEALAKLASTGQVVSASLSQAAEASVRFARVGGDVDTLVKKFAALGKDPLKAIVDINEAENFLTESVYKQVKALSEQGRIVEATTVAQQAYAAAVNGRAQQIEQSLGSIERAWMSVKDAAKLAWDAMLNIGRQETTANLDREIATLQRRQQILASGNAEQKTSAILIGERVAALQKQRAELAEIEREQRRYADTLAGQAREVKASIKADEDKKKAVKDLGDAFAADRAAAKEWADAFLDFSKIQADAEASTLGLTKGQARLVEYLQSPAYKNVSEEMQKIALNSAYAAIAAEQNAEATKAATKAYEDHINELEHSAAAIAKQVESLQEEEKASGLAAAGNISLAQAIQDVAIARLQDERAKQLSFGDEKAAAAIQKEIESRKQLKDLIAGKEARDLAQKTAEEAAREWQRVSDQIGQGLTDSLFRAFEKGQSFFKTLWDGIVNTFKTTTLRLLIQGVDGKGGIVGSLLSAIGLTGSSSGSGGLGGSLSTLSSLQSLWGSAGSSASGLGLAFVNSGLGQSLGLSSAQIIGGNSIVGPTAAGSSFLSGASSFAGPAAAILAGMIASGNAFDAGYSQHNLPLAAQILFPEHKFDTNLLSKVVGDRTANIISGAALTSQLFSKLFGSPGTPHSGAGYVSDGSTGFDVKNGQYGLGGAQGDSTGRYYNQGVEDALKSITGGAASVLNNLSQAFGGAANFQVGGYFASDNNRGSNFGRSVLLNGQVISQANGNNLDKDPTKGLQQLADDLADQVKSALTRVDLPGWARDQVAALGSDVSFDQINQVAASIIATQQALKDLGAVMPQLGSLTDDATTALLKSFDGIQNLQAAASSYYDNFYTDAQKTANATQQLGDALAALGFETPKTREAYRALVEEQKLNTESGQAAYAALIKLSPAFAALVPATEDLGKTAEETAKKMAEAGQKALADLAEQQGGLLVDLLTAQGDVEGAAALARQNAIAKLTAGLSETDAAAAVAALDYNTALKQQIDALNAAAAAEANRQAQRDNIQAQIDQLLGDTAAVRARELAALDESNRALKLRLYALEDEQAAAQKAAEAMQAFKSSLDGLADARFDLENQLLTLQGNLASVAARTRDRDLARLTAGLSEDDAKKIAAAYDYNVALKQQIDATQQAQKQAEDYAAAQQRAADESARAAQQIADAWKSAANSVLDEVARIRNQVAGDSSASFAQSQAKFAITLAQAGAGDIEAFKLLPQLSQAMLSIGEQQAVSFTDLQSLRTRTAASLESLANRLGFSLPAGSSSGAAAASSYTPAPLQPSTFTAQAQSTQDDLLAQVKSLTDEVIQLRKQVDQSNVYASRSAEALEGNQSVPILVEIA